MAGREEASDGVARECRCALPLLQNILLGVGRARNGSKYFSILSVNAWFLTAHNTLIYDITTYHSLRPATVILSWNLILELFINRRKYLKILKC